MKRIISRSFYLSSCRTCKKFKKKKGKDDKNIRIKCRVKDLYCPTLIDIYINNKV